MTEKKKPAERTPLEKAINAVYGRAGSTLSLVQDLHNALGIPADPERHEDTMQQALEELQRTVQGANERLDAVEGQLLHLSNQLAKLLSAVGVDE
jgi:hypothetical protein